MPTKPKKAQPTTYAFDRLVQTTLDNLARSAKDKVKGAQVVASFTLLRYDVAHWPDSCELILSDSKRPVVIDLDRGSVSAIPGTVDDPNPLEEAHRQQFPEINADEDLTQDADLVQGRALLGRLLNVARAQLARGVPAALAAAGLKVAPDASGALTDRDSTDTAEDIEEGLRLDVSELAKLAKRHSQKAPRSFQGLTELVYSEAPGRSWLGALARGKVDQPPSSAIPQPRKAAPRGRVVEASLRTASCPTAKLRPGAQGTDDPGIVYGVGFDPERALLFLATRRRVSGSKGAPLEREYRTRLSVYSSTDLMDLKLLGQAECEMREFCDHAEIRRDGDELKVFGSYSSPASYLGFDVQSPGKPTVLGQRSDALAERLVHAGLSDPKRILRSSSSELAVVLGRGARVIRPQGDGYAATPLVDLPVHDAALVMGDRWVAIAYSSVAHRPDLEFYEVASAQKVARLKLDKVSALFGADEHLWVARFEEKKTDHYGYELLDLNLESQPVVVRRLALPGLQEGSPADAQCMVLGLFVRGSQALVVWPEEFAVFELPS